jgi:predicted dehydrogenase
MNFGLVGLGRWGKNYIKVLSRLGQKIPVICSRSNNILQSFHQLEVGSLWYSDYKALCNHSSIDTVIVATPPQSHYEITKYALECGKHVICEKPFVFKLEEAKELWTLSQKQKRHVLVDFIHCWQPGLQEVINKKVDRCFIESYVRDLPTNPRHHSVFWDWATHDIALVLSIVKEMPTGYNAFYNKGSLREASGLLLRLSFENESDATISINTESKTKSRALSIKNHVLSVIEDFTWKDDFQGNPLQRMLESFISKPHSNIELAVGVTGIMETIGNWYNGN